MHELWSSASYEPHLLSLPFAFAPAGMAVVIAYALVMRGEPVLRAWMLVHFVSLMPYSIVMALSPSVTSPAAADAMFRIAAAFIPTAAAAGAGFQLALLGLTARRRWRLLVWAGVAVAVAWIVAGALTDAAVGGVYRPNAGLWYATAGPWAWLGLLTTLAVATPGFVLLAIAASRQKPSQERRQLRLVLVANVVTYAALTDVALAYHVGVFPLGWLLSGAGSVLVVRALIFEDLLRARAVDTTAPQALLHFALATLLAWASLAMLGSRLVWWGGVATLVVCFAGVRTSLAIVGLVTRGGRSAEGTLDRLLGQLVQRARTLRAEPEVAQLAIDVIELGLGTRVQVLIAAAEDYGWTTAAGRRLADDAAPDPLLGAWLAEQRGAIFDDELELKVPEDLRELLARVLAGGPDRARAHTVVPTASHDELLALLFVPQAAKRLRGRQLAFLERAAQRLGEGLVHVRMAQRAAARATLAREVDLAATVQAQLLPGKGPHVHGEVTVVGSWLPATRCAGDFWGVYPLAGHRVLVAIGDVTGHGVASATVTAAAAAACDVTVRRHGGALELDALVGALDAAVLRVGGGQLSMTCFAAILDPEAREIRYVSCGHTTPYVCSADERVELHALVGRGNPLGTGNRNAPKVQQRPLRAGDLVVWYTDGVIEAQDPAGEPFGDRRLQRMLRRLDRATLSPPAVHDLVFASVAAHRAGRARNDDETLVVAQWAPAPAASIEPAKQAST